MNVYYIYESQDRVIMGRPTARDVPQNSQLPPSRWRADGIRVSTWALNICTTRKWWTYRGGHIRCWKQWHRWNEIDVEYSCSEAWTSIPMGQGGHVPYATKYLDWRDTITDAPHIWGVMHEICLNSVNCMEFGQSILRDIIKIFATRCRIF